MAVQVFCPFCSFSFFLLIWTSYFYILKMNPWLRVLNHRSKGWGFLLPQRFVPWNSTFPINQILWCPWVYFWFLYCFIYLLTPPVSSCFNCRVSDVFVFNQAGPVSAVFFLRIFPVIFAGFFFFLQINFHFISLYFFNPTKFYLEFHRSVQFEIMLLQCRIYPTTRTCFWSDATFCMSLNRS